MRVFWAILWKDVRQEWRRRELVLVMAIFSLVVLVLFNFALGLTPDRPTNVSAAVMWIAFSFAGTLGLNRSLAMERDDQCLRALLLSPADRSWIYLAKVTGNLLFLLVVEVMVVPLTLILFNIGIPDSLGWLALTCFLGTLGFVGVGTLLAGMATSTRMRDWILPLLLFPIQVPVLISAVQATQLLLANRPIVEVTLWLKLMTAFDLVFVAASIMAFEFIVEE
jgi:heme exporter protein B